MSDWLSWIVEGGPTGLFREGLMWGLRRQLAASGLALQAAWVLGGCPPGNRSCGAAFFSDVTVFFVFSAENSLRKKPQWKFNHWPSSYFIALAEVIFRTIMTIFGWWFLVHSRCEFLCWRLSCLYLIKVKFPDLNPVTFPSVFRAMGLWCQLLNMCLGGKRSVSGHYFDSLPHHCFSLRPDVPGEIETKN